MGLRRGHRGQLSGTLQDRGAGLREAEPSNLLFAFMSPVSVLPATAATGLLIK